MTAKILTLTGDMVHHGMYRSLTPEVFAVLIKQDHMNAFLWMTEDRWGSFLARGKLEDVGLADTPDPKPYLDNKQTNKTFPALNNKVTQEASDENVHVSIMLLCC